MYAKEHLLTSLVHVVQTLEQEWPQKAVIEPPRDPRHGDLATNVAMVLAKPMGLPPRDLAAQIAEGLRSHNKDIEKVDIAGPGFINVTFSPIFWQNVILRIEEAGSRFGASNVGQAERVQIEYVSANPTGPLHIGHGRGAAVGDSLARILRFAGYTVSTEYYINDAGLQMQLLGRSIFLRALELAKKPVTWPESFYRGEYIIAIAQKILEKNPELVNLDPKSGEHLCYTYGMQTILDGIKEDLQAFRVEHEVFFSERSLTQENAIEKAFQVLKEQGLLFEEGGALWFRTTDFGDDKDRVLRKSDGTLTYFSSDIAYHAHKLARGFTKVIDIWGADHHGYIPRMRAAISAMGYTKDTLEVVLIQLVNLLEGGVQVAMSTRSGQFETLKDVMEEVGVDAARFMFLCRKSDTSLDFDLELAKQRTMENPVYYVQYAHARVCSMERKAKEAGLHCSKTVDMSVLQNLTQAEELALLRLLERFEDTANSAAVYRSPHMVCNYLTDLAGALHSYYAKFPVVQVDEPDLTQARLALMAAVGRVLANGLDLLGVEAPSSM